MGCGRLALIDGTMTENPVAMHDGPWCVEGMVILGGRRSLSMKPRSWPRVESYEVIDM